VRVGATESHELQIWALTTELTADLGRAFTLDLLFKQKRRRLRARTQGGGPGTKELGSGNLVVRGREAMLKGVSSA